MGAGGTRYLELSRIEGMIDCSTSNVGTLDRLENSVNSYTNTQHEQLQPEQQTKNNYVNSLSSFQAILVQYMQIKSNHHLN